METRTSTGTPSLAEQAWDLRGRDPATALVLADSALADPTDRIEEGRALSARGYARLRLGEPGPAADDSRRAEAIGREIGDDQGRARAILVRGVLDRGSGRYADAVRALHDAHDAYRAAGDPAGAAGAFVNLALVYKNLGDAPRALALLLDAQRIFRERGDRYGEALTLNNIVGVYRDLGNDAAALPLAERAAELARDMDGQAFEGAVLTELGSILHRLGDRERSKAILERAVEIATSTGIPQYTGEALGALGIHLADEDPDRARELLEQAIDIYGRTFGDIWNLSVGLCALGDLHRQRGRPADARECYERAAEFANSRGERARSEIAHRGAALVCEDLGDLAAAVAHWRAANNAGTAAGEDRNRRVLTLLEVSAAISEARAEAERHKGRISDLAAVNRFRTDLLGMVAHDLRSPLTAATLTNGLMSETFTDPAVQRMCAQVQTALARMTRIVEALDDDTAVEHGRLYARWGREEVLGLVAAVVEEYAPVARNKKQRVVVGGTAVYSMVDAGRLVHAIDNLVSNALKYSPIGGSVWVDVSADDTHVRIAVRDRGPGLPPDASTWLFKPFSKGPNLPTGGERSTGFGLYIARRMVELHRGTLGVHPGEGGVGSTFWISIPRDGTPAS